MEKYDAKELFEAFNIFLRQYKPATQEGEQQFGSEAKEAEQGAAVAQEGNEDPLTAADYLSTEKTFSAAKKKFRVGLNHWKVRLLYYF